MTDEKLTGQIGALRREVYVEEATNAKLRAGRDFDLIEMLCNKLDAQPDKCDKKYAVKGIEWQAAWRALAILLGVAIPVAGLLLGILRFAKAG